MSRTPSRLQFFLEDTRVRNQYIKCQFERVIFNIYVRKGLRYIDGIAVPSVLDIGSITSSKPGSGKLRGLLAWMLHTLQDNGYNGLYIESVFHERLAITLQEIGFRQVNQDYGTPNFYKEASLP